MLGDEEKQRLEATRTGDKPWKKWGPYLSERQWWTVREDYSESGSAWNYLTHEMARSKAYRWGEDGMAAICDRYQILVFSLKNGHGFASLPRTNQEQQRGCFLSDVDHELQIFTKLVTALTKPSGSSYMGM